VAPAQSAEPNLDDIVFDPLTARAKDAFLQAKHHVFDPLLRTPPPGSSAPAAPACPLFPVSAEAFLLQLAQGDFVAKKLQHALTEQVEDAKALGFRKSQSETDRACTDSHYTSGTACLHTRPALSNTTRLSKSAQETLCKLRTQTLQLPAHLCTCGKSTLESYHVLSCGSLRGRTIRHDVIATCLLSMFLAAGFVARKEVFVVEGTSKRMDVVVYLPNSVIWIDFSVVNPTKKTYRNKNKAACELRADEKESKYGTHAERKGVKLIPAIMDVFGAAGKGLTSVLSMLAIKALENHPYPISSDANVWRGKYRLKLMQHLQVALAHANHLMFEEARMRSFSSWTNSKTTKMYKGLRRYRKFSQGYAY
jgi:hypothetical protein